MKTEETKVEYEFDSSPERWEYYPKIYDGIAPKEKPNGSRIYKYMNVKGKEIKVGGDCFFNFKDLKVKNFSKIEGVNEDDLNNLNENHYSEKNCVLLPVDGGLNNVKGNIYLRDGKIVLYSKGPKEKCYDRPDTFLCLIEDFYKKKDTVKDLETAGKFFTHSIFKEALKAETFSTLYETMTSFNGVYDFGYAFLGIGNGDDAEKFIDRMLKNGRKPIADKKDLENYIDLAKTFWKLRENYEKQRRNQ